MFDTVADARNCSEWVRCFDEGLPEWFANATDLFKLKPDDDVADDVEWRCWMPDLDTRLETENTVPRDVILAVGNDANSNMSALLVTFMF